MSDKKETTHSMKCKNPNGKCPSITVTEFRVAKASGNRLYKCVKCNYVWPVSVGGSINI